MADFKKTIATAKAGALMGNRMSERIGHRQHATGASRGLNRAAEGPRDDWAAAATEARRQRDAEAKQGMAERKRSRAAANAWSPQHEISRIRRV